MSLGGRPKEVEQHSYRAAKQLLPGRPPKLIHTLTPSSRHLTHRDAATWCARPWVAGPSPTALHPAVLALMRGCMPNTACPGPALADYSALAERQLALSGLAPFAALCAAPAERQLALSGPAPFRPRAAPAERQLCHPALSALLRHLRSFSSASRGWQPLCPFMALPRLAALAERQLCRT